MSRTPTAQLSPADQERRRGLRRMKAVAAGALAAMAVLFAVAFVLQQGMPGWAYVRAAAEGGMVGALADWFAVTALFRRPLGLPIPHTAIIPHRKDEIGRSLGEFVETNFLSATVVRDRLAALDVAGRLGGWLAEPDHAERVCAEASALAGRVLAALSDDDVEELMSDLAREHLVSPDWAPTAGLWLQRAVASGAHVEAVDLAADSLAGWLSANEAAFEGLASRRLPSWVPSIARRLVDEALYREAVAFVRAVRTQPDHPARLAIEGYLARLAHGLQDDPDTRARLEGAKSAAFDSPRVRELAAQAWAAAKNGLTGALADPESALRRRARAAVQEIGMRLQTDRGLRERADRWISDSAAFLVERYRHDLASIITETVQRWDAEETTEKIELLVGRDLQYIRLNGTIVGSLAGLVIYTVAHALWGA